jgi:hypothetical protein
MIGEKGWTNSLGEFVWTQEIVDETIHYYPVMTEKCPFVTLDFRRKRNVPIT